MDSYSLRSCASTVLVFPKLWNALSAELRSISSLSAFKSSLKTHLFKLAFDI